jgi:DNA integrity scanning protein DisA with diadenylate cyclase activity
VPHPYIQERKTHAPVKVADQLPRDNSVKRFNSWLAVKITGGVGTMWCAYIFALIALISLPDALKAGRAAIISWIAQTFLQLVLLSIIIVGQNILSAAADQRSLATYNDADAVLHEAMQIQQHLEAQDQAIEKILSSVKQAGGPGPRTPSAPAPT